MTMTAEHIAHPQMVADFRALAAEWQGRAITAEFDVGLCRVTCKHKECINGFRWHPEPPMPAKFRNYIDLSENDRAVWLQANPGFFNAGVVPEYFVKRSEVRAVNHRNMEQLKVWLKLPLEAEERAIVAKALDSYSGRMD